MHTTQARTLAAILICAAGCQARESRAPSSATASTTVSSHSVIDTAPPVDSPAAVISRPVVDSTPAAVIRRYYSAIQSHRFDDAYALWSDSGRASKQTAPEFAAGFSQTATVSVAIGDSVRIEGAAGSQYATVPVVVDATLRSGERQKFVGTYTLRRAMVDGATREQRQWRIYSAQLRRE